MKNFEIHSGGAEGSDSLFDKFAPENATIVHHSFDGHKLSKGLRGVIEKHSIEELRENFKAYENACRNVGRYISKNSYVQNLCLRNYFQVSNANLIVAVVEKITNFTKCICEGGTGYAVDYARQMGKPILVYNQADCFWYFAQNGEGFRVSKNQNPNWAMIKYTNIAGIGTRNINSNGENAIRGFFADNIKETPQTTVVNIKYEKADIYIGRGSIWGNPFVMKGTSQKERDRVCDEYEQWFYTQPELIAQLHTLKGKSLGCYCKPLRCHGDFLAKLANNSCDIAQKRYTPYAINSLKEGEIFVFGSNLQGIHGKGASLTARKFGAKIGVGEGLQSQTYALPTKRTPYEPLTQLEVAMYIGDFIEVAKSKPNLTFLVTKVGCGNAGLQKSK